MPPAFPHLSTRIAALTVVQMAFQVEIAKREQEFRESTRMSAVTVQRSVRRVFGRNSPTKYPFTTGTNC